jgi:phenylacetate-CoA ligase
MAAPLQFHSPQAAQLLLLAQQLRAWERAAPAEQQALQQQALQGLMQHAHRHSPFWQQRLQAAGFVPTVPGVPALQVLARLPPLTRTDLQMHFEPLRARWPGLQEADIATSATSGSTGEPVRVEKASSMYGPLYAAVSWAETQWHQRDPALKIAVLGTGLADGMQDTWGSMYSALGLRGACVTRNVTQHGMPSHLDWLLQHRPDYLKCSPHAAAELARLLIGRGLSLPIRQIISQSERVTPVQRALCLQAFGAKIVDRYSCEETGWIALQCPQHDHLHQLAATTLLEIVDGQGQPCPAGVPGRVLVTSLHSFAMPILRYELGDIAEWGAPCGCGMALPVIARLWGRTRHQVQSPHGPLPMPFLGDELGRIDPIRAFRIRQYADGTLVLQIEAPRALGAGEQAAVRAVFAANGLADLPLHVEHLERIDWPAGPKREEFERMDGAFAPGQ